MVSMHELHCDTATRLEPCILELISRGSRFRKSSSRRSLTRRRRTRETRRAPGGTAPFETAERLALGSGAERKNMKHFQWHYMVGICCDARNEQCRQIRQCRNRTGVSGERVNQHIRIYLFQRLVKQVGWHTELPRRRHRVLRVAPNDVGAATQVQIFVCGPDESHNVARTNGCLSKHYFHTFFVKN